MNRDPERRLRRALADPCLQHPELAALDGELDVAHVAVVALQPRHDRHQLVVGPLVHRLEVGERHRVTDPGDDVLALGVLQVVAVDALGPAGRVAGEGDARAGVHAEVAEDHGLDVDRRAEVLGDPLLPAVEPGAVGVPRVEDGADRQVELLARVLGEGPPCVLLHDLLEGRDESAQVVGVEVEVVVGAVRTLRLVEGVGEVFGVDAEDGGAEHLEQAAVGVQREPLVVALVRQAAHRLVVQADVEDGLHHSWHRELRTGAHADQERVLGVTEGAAHGLLEGGEVLGDLVGHLVRLAALGQVGLAGLGGDGEAGRHGQPEVRHLGEVGALATQQVLLVLVAVGEVVDE